MTTITKTIAALSIVTFGAFAHAESDTCHVYTAGEGQKMECVEAKVNNKLNQLAAVAASIKTELRQLANRPDDSATDAAERQARIEKLNMALKGIQAEAKEAIQNAKSDIRKAANRPDDSATDAAERQARMEKVKNVVKKIDSKLDKAASKMDAFLKSIFGNDND